MQRPAWKDEEWLFRSFQRVLAGHDQGLNELQRFCLKKRKRPDIKTIVLKRDRDENDVSLNKLRLEIKLYFRPKRSRADLGGEGPHSGTSALFYDGAGGRSLSPPAGDVAAGVEPGTAALSV